MTTFVNGVNDIDQGELDAGPLDPELAKQVRIQEERARRDYDAYRAIVHVAAEGVLSDEQHEQLAELRDRLKISAQQFIRDRETVAEWRSLKGSSGEYLSLAADVKKADAVARAAVEQLEARIKEIEREIAAAWEPVRVLAGQRDEAKARSDRLNDREREHWKIFGLDDPKAPPTHHYLIQAGLAPVSFEAKRASITTLEQMMLAPQQHASGFRAHRFDRHPTQSEADFQRIKKIATFIVDTGIVHRYIAPADRRPAPANGLPPIQNEQLVYWFDKASESRSTVTFVQAERGKTHVFIPYPGQSPEEFEQLCKEFDAAAKKRDREFQQRQYASR